MKIKKIESDNNSTYKTLLKLTKSKGIDKQHLCLVSGEKILQETFNSNKMDLENSFWIYSQANHPLIKKNPLPTVIELSKDLFKELDVLGTKSPVMCTPPPKIQSWKPSADPKGKEIFCALGDPYNLGALIRSAKAFNMDSIILLEESCHPFHPRAIKASAGTVFTMNLFKGPSIQKLEGNMDLWALDAKGADIKSLKFKKNMRLLLGEEGQGIPDHLKCKKISIAMNKDVESLNATVAASILFYSLQNS